MRQLLRAAGLAAAAVVLLAGGIATAQMIKQIRLTGAHVESYIAAQKDMAPLADKMQSSTSNKPDAKLQAELEAAAKKHGFKDFSEYDDVAANIAIIMAGIDPATKSFVEPSDAIKREIEEVAADKSVPAAEKQKMLADLNEALKAAPAIQYSDNIELVKKHFDRLEAALQ